MTVTCLEALKLCLRSISNFLLKGCSYCLAKIAFIWIFNGDDYLNMHCDHGRNLVGNRGDVFPHFFRRGGHNMPCSPTFLSLGFVFGEVSKIKAGF